MAEARIALLERHGRRARRARSRPRGRARGTGGALDTRAERLSRLRERLAAPLKRCGEIVSRNGFTLVGGWDLSFGGVLSRGTWCGAALLPLPLPLSTCSYRASLNFFCGRCWEVQVVSDVLLRVSGTASQLFFFVDCDVAQVRFCSFTTLSRERELLDIAAASCQTPSRLDCVQRAHFAT